MSDPRVTVPYDTFVILKGYVDNVALEDLVEFTAYTIEMYTEHNWPLVAYGIGSGDGFREFRSLAIPLLYNRVIVMQELNAIMESVKNSTI